MGFLESIPDAILNRSPEELIGAMLIAALIGIVMASLYALNRRKSPPSPTFVGVLALVAGASGMALAAGFFERGETGSMAGWPKTLRSPRPLGGTGGRGMPPPWLFSGPGWSSGFHVVLAADGDRDGRLTPDEAARLVRKADSDGDGSVELPRHRSAHGGPLSVSLPAARHRRRQGR